MTEQQQLKRPDWMVKWHAMRDAQAAKKAVIDEVQEPTAAEEEAPDPVALQAQLHDAVVHGDAPQTATLIAKGAVPEQKTLAFAVNNYTRSGWAEILIRAGAKPTSDMLRTARERLGSGSKLEAVLIAGGAVPPETPAEQKPATREVGHRMQDGTIYLGRYKGRDGIEKNWFAAADDASNKKGKKLSLSFKEAAKYAKESQAHGHNDWMLPPAHFDSNGEPDILNVLYANKTKIGGFDVASNSPFYWSSSYNEPLDYMRVRDFSNGLHLNSGKKNNFSIRLVRS